MREFSLEELYKELLRIKVEENPSDARFDALLDDVYSDLTEAHDGVESAMAAEVKKPVFEWWAAYPNLGIYI